VLNILLVGIDDGQVGQIDNRTDPARADSIMVLHVPASHDRGYIVSIPRDSWVKIPKYPKTGFGGGSAKINAAYTYGFGDPKKPGFPGRAGGLDLLMQTINKETGITFNAAATVNFTGFTQAVTALGGVTMYIDEKVTSVHYGTDKKTGAPCTPALFDDNAIAHPISTCKAKVYDKGTRRLSPEEALDYTRQREWMELGDGDYGRQRHQQQFIKALVREAKAQGLTTNLPKALSLISTVGSTLTMWTNGVKLEDWFFTLKDVAGSDISMIKTNGGTYNSADVTGTSAEALSDLTKQMFVALRENRIDAWLLQHPDWLGSDSVS
jgi:LCP family protein required for cell wall assembly